MVIFFFPSL